MTKEDGFIPAIVLTPHQTFFHAEVYPRLNGADLRIHYKEGFDKKVGDLVAIRDVLIDINEMNEPEPE